MKPRSVGRSPVRTVLSGAAAVTLLLTGTVSGPGAALAGGTPPAAPQVQTGASQAQAAGPDHRTVTLITGDRVTLLPSGFAIRPAEGRDTMRFVRYQVDDHDYVIPADALDLLRAGRLDLRLFDVAGLIAQGYSDADRADLPLVVTGGPAGTAGGSVAAAALGAADVHVTGDLSTIGMTAVRVDKPDATRVWEAIREAVTPGPAAAGGPAAAAADGVRVWLDGVRHLDLDQSVHQVNAPAAWQAGWTGAGVTVAVLDSGVDATHPDLADRIVDIRDFTDGSGTFSEEPAGADTIGHGTHVASIVAGSGSASGGRYRGVAPDARLLIGKVCPARFCHESAVLAGMVWAAEQGAAVVNLSLSGPDTPGTDLLEQAVNELTAQFDTLFVASAGNEGSSQPVGSPASADAALAVGSVSRFDDVSWFSSRGPRTGDVAVKPDLTAPGEQIVAARAAGTALDDPVDEHYVRASGTSMAAPHVAGAAALLRQQHPSWTAAQVKAALMGSAAPNPFYTVFDQGAGRLDLAAAVDQTVVASPPSLSFGLLPFPHDGEPVERVVTLHNLGDATVDLQLSLSVRGPGHEPAPAGMFSVSPEAVTLPPGGRAEVTVTADARVPGPFGVYSGTLQAGGDGVTVRVPLGLDKESERYHLTISHIDRSGTPTGDYVTTVAGLDSHVSEVLFGGQATTTLRLPPGRYHLFSTVHTPTGGVPDTAGLAVPLVELTGDTEVTLDARAAQPMRVEVPKAGARSAAAVVRYERRAPEGRPVGNAIAGPDLDHMYTAHLGPAVADDELVAAVYSFWGAPGQAGDFTDSPYAYHLVFFERGRYWTGFDRKVSNGDLAAVTTEYRTPKAGSLGEHAATGTAPEGSDGAAHYFRVRPPFSRVNYYVSRDVRWSHEYRTVDPVNGFVETVHTEHPVSYEPGWQGTGGPRQVWGEAVYGPAFPREENTTQWIYRHSGATPSVAGAGVAQGSDAMVVSVPLFNEAAPDRPGFSLVDTARTALYVDGRLIGEVPWLGGEFPVPDEPGTYRVEMEATRPSYADLSTRVSASWTFRSAHVPGGEPVVMPVMAVRFGPRLDADNSIPGGRTFVLPVWVQRQHGAAPADVTSLEVEVSYDDGATWQPVPVIRPGSEGLVLLRHPDGPGFVSLRATATDSAGGATEVTIIRAFRLTG
ncbi:MAG: S8 family serine peptidase [Micromonosporaceae bacterium]